MAKSSIKKENKSTNEERKVHKIPVKKGGVFKSGISKEQSKSTIKNIKKEIGKKKKKEDNLAMKESHKNDSSSSLDSLEKKSTITTRVPSEVKLEESDPKKFKEKRNSSESSSESLSENSSENSLKESLAKVPSPKNSSEDSDSEDSSESSSSENLSEHLKSSGNMLKKPDYSNISGSSDASSSSDSSNSSNESCLSDESSSDSESNSDSDLNSDSTSNDSNSENSLKGSVSIDSTVNKMQETKEKVNSRVKSKRKKSEIKLENLTKKSSQNLIENETGRTNSPQFNKDQDDEPSDIEELSSNESYNNKLIDNKKLKDNEDSSDSDSSSDNTSNNNESDDNKNSTSTDGFHTINDSNNNSDGDLDDSASTSTSSSSGDSSDLTSSSSGDSASNIVTDSTSDSETLSSNNKNTKHSTRNVLSKKKAKETKMHLENVSKNKNIGNNFSKSENISKKNKHDFKTEHFDNIDDKLEKETSNFSSHDSTKKLSDNKNIKDNKNSSRKRKNASIEMDKKETKKNKTNIGEDAEGSKTIFVGGLSWNVDDSWLAKEFESVGTVLSSRVISNKNSGKSKGFGYVEFSTPEEAQAALAYSGKEIDGRVINVDISTGLSSTFKNNANIRANKYGDVRSPKSDTLFIGNLSFKANEEAVRSAFSRIGGIVEIRLPTNRKTGQLKGFGYIQFSSIGDAERAIEMNGHLISGRPIRLDFSIKKDNITDTTFNSSLSNYKKKENKAPQRVNFGGKTNSTNRSGFNEFSGKKTKF
ncbi:hypothetical protein T552_01619 [Pneumocystis carinii B80]|uniref:RRM domain-containing protein n=1 Tax=Pneumocystis carinii (strain B80) TaxID=1408658 RepID=A0A0W4ZJ17_PNEC8|nr:hypothetical protein T552_01619 [Pneumocystis carinii B80]KTW28359.1 hypothetical protein T552_01619 [Pneumocystis carinii B80]